MTASRRVVCTVAVGSGGRRMHDLTRPSQRAYARRHGCDYVALRGPDTDYPLGQKLRIVELLDTYDRVLYLDADAFVSASADDIFAVVPDAEIGLHDDTPLLPSKGWLYAEQSAVCRSQGWEPVDAGCLNTGVIVFGRGHRAAFVPPPRPCPRTHCTEQHVVGLNIARSGILVHRLKGEWNWQWWADPSRAGIDSAKIVHWAKPVGVSDEERLDVMRSYAFPNGVPECEARGGRPSPDERVAYGLDVLRDWRKCQSGVSHGRGPFVCHCTGCGPTCDSYCP